MVLCRVKLRMMNFWRGLGGDAWIDDCVDDVLGTEAV
jgi:hypothetical protein